MQTDWYSVFCSDDYRMPKIISLAEQVNLLFQHGREHGLPVTYRAVAKATGETGNNLFRIRHGHNKNPGLRTLSAIVEYFETDLGYFSCQTKEDCLSYLNRPQERLSAE